MPHQDRQRCISIVRRLLCEHLIEHDAQRIEIAAHIALPLQSLLRSDIVQRSHQRPRCGVPGAPDNLRDAKVDQHGLSVSSQQDIGRLDIAVHHPFAVSVRQTIQDIEENARHLSQRHVLAANAAVVKTRLLIVTAAVLVAVVLVYLTLGRPAPEPAPDVAVPPPVWNLEMLELSRVSIELPVSGKSKAWVKREDKQWYFDEPDGPEVDRKRWGGGIPLILSGPHANRLIASAVTDEQLEIYGFKNPVMKIGLNTENEKVDIVVGNSTPDGQSYYIMLAESSDVFSVDYSWFDVLERLVVEPPYSQ